MMDKYQTDSCEFEYKLETNPFDPEMPMEHLEEIHVLLLKNIDKSFK